MLPDISQDRPDDSALDAGSARATQAGAHPNVWNPWIIWPAMVCVLLTAGDAWLTFGRKPISESESQREIDRQAGQPR